MKKISLLCLLIGLLALLVLPVAAVEMSGTCGKNLVWKYDMASETLTISGTGPMDDWGRKERPGWADLNAWHYYTKHVIIEEGVTTIGLGAFYNCGVETVSLPSTLTHIGDLAFSCCWDMKEIDFPNNIISIGANAFASCDGISELQLPEALESIGSEAFWGMKSLEKVKIGPNIKHISDVAFGACTNLSVIEFTSDVPIFDEHTFLGVDGVTVVYPADNPTWTADKLQDYDGNVIWTPLVQGTCGENLTWQLKGTVLTISGNGKVMFDPLPSTADKEYPPWFKYRSNVKEVVVKPGVTGFDYRAFQHCKNLKRVTLPDTLQSIGSQMFHGCDNLASIEIPSGVTTIDSMAFLSCVSLKRITIPESVTLIKDEAFAGCTALEEVSIMGSPKIWYACFEGCESLKTVKCYGDVSVWDSMCFNGVTATAYYPAGNPTWTKDKLIDYGGKLTWVPFGCTKHDEVTDAAVAAGCLTAGKTAGAHCSKCGVVTKAQQAIPAKGHSFGDWKQTKAPTTQAAGQETRSCKNCSAVENREIPKLTQQPSGQDPTQPKPTQPEQTTPVPTDPEETVPPTVPDSTQPQQTQPEGATATDPKEDPTQPDAPEQEAPKSTPWIAIAIAGGMILAGGGAAAWYFVLRKRK